MIICDTGPLVSALNSGEKNRHRFAAALLSRLGTKVIVPWPVFVETDLLIRARGYPDAALIFGENIASGIHRLESPTTQDLQLALKLGKQFSDSGADLPDLIVMAMSQRFKAKILTWDFRHFRTVVLRRGHHWPLLVGENELPAP